MLSEQELQGLTAALGNLSSLPTSEDMQLAHRWLRACVDMHGYRFGYPDAPEPYRSMFAKWAVRHADFILSYPGHEFRHEVFVKNTCAVEHGHTPCSECGKTANELPAPVYPEQYRAGKSSTINV